VGGALAVTATAAAALQWSHMRRIDRDPEHARLANPPRGRVFTTRSADGTQIHAESFGPEAGQTIVLAHGWTETLSYWTYVVQELTASGFRVVAFDMRGHGESEPARSGDYSLGRFGEDVEAVLQNSVTAGERVVLAGHSLGAMSIVAWADRHEVEERVSAVALINTGVGGLVSEHLVVPVPAIAGAINQLLAVRVFLGARTPLPRYSTPLTYAVIRHVAFGPAATPARVAFYERMVLRCAADVRGNVGIAMSEMELYHALPRLTVPTLVWAGADDRLTPPSHAWRIADELPRLERVVVLPKTGHMGPLERPKELSHDLAELAAKVAVHQDAAGGKPSVDASDRVTGGGCTSRRSDVLPSAGRRSRARGRGSG
jgi:pimeloyl-ACP methyl ester carboxylesterase